MMEQQMRVREELRLPRPPVVRVLQCLLFGYLITGALLLLLAGLLYKMQLSEQVVSIGIIVIYVVSALVSGLIAGKKAGNRKYLWGLLQGGLYFAVLLIMTLAVKRSVSDFGPNLVTTFLLCTGSGMLGGMLA
ncbi:MAG: TIGR04086 family membrane protein [bacterium]|nr:TIGR04086 family membrane protein [bacterium]